LLRDLLLQRHLLLLVVDQVPLAGGVDARLGRRTVNALQ
jgi:hypothetical protein